METGQKNKKPPKILIVDDISMNVKILENIILEEGYEALCAISVQEALELMEYQLPELILSDLSMPGMNGLDFCRLLKGNPRTRDIPFIFITVADSREEKKAAFSAGAVDFIPKPFEPTEVVMRVNNQLHSARLRQEMEDYNRMMHRMVVDQKAQMEKELENVLLAMVTVVEKRMPGLGKHMERVGDNCRLLAQSLQFVSEYENQVTDEFVDTIGTAARLHDIGNLLLSDEILRKKETSEEGRREVIRLRAEEGAGLLEELSKGSTASRFLDLAIPIARYHHACWDGTGYPAGIGGTDIPLAARITAVVNDFDNLLRARQDGETRSVEECVSRINEGKGTHYDPGIVDVFQRILKKIRVE